MAAGKSAAAAGPCPCGGKNYKTCCGRFIDDGQIPSRAPELMRSRYTAFANRNEAYLRSTWHPDTLPADELTGESDVKWIGLSVGPDTQDGDDATVEFTARFKVGGRAHKLREISNFERMPDDAGQLRWYYVDGSFPDIAE